MNQTTAPPGDGAAAPPPPPAGYDPDTGPRITGEQARDVARLRRSAWDRKIAGVAGGIGRHFDIDPTVVRVLLVVLCFFGGAGFLLYAGGWLLVPDERTGRAVIPSSDEARKWLLYGGLGLAAVITLGGGWGGWSWGPTVPLVIFALLGVALLVSRDGHRQQAAASTAPTARDAAPWPQSDVDAPAPPTAAAGWSGGGDQPPPRAAWAPPPYLPPAQRPARPRRTGLVLFWPTLALVAAALGTLGIYDASHAVTAAAYPALALAVVGLMLVVGAFRGRSGGLVLLGVVAAIALAISSITGGFSQGTSTTYDPRQAGDVRSSYSMQSGEIVLNLSNLDDVRALDGRTIDVSGDAGELLVIVPRDLRVDIDADIDALGGIDIGPTDTRGGLSPTATRSFSGDTASPTLDLDVHLRVGHIEVRNDRE